ncbi:hypothetical protein NKI98_29520 [Mesorhizobium sp. M0222]|uniref:hypothetical protein n=1 Tax=Mesorhizobium sp. M0222 TaxID=2956921 RepID=UPI0033380DAF
MAAEFGRPAELDRAHHTPLDTSEMAVMNLPIRLAMPAQDIRRLQSRRHRRDRSAGGTTSMFSRSSGLILAISLLLIQRLRFNSRNPSNRKSATRPAKCRVSGFVQF